jgi:hypothetical protein
MQNSKAPTGLKVSLHIIPSQDEPGGTNDSQQSGDKHDFLGPSRTKRSCIQPCLNKSTDRVLNSKRSLCPERKVEPSGSPETTNLPSKVAMQNNILLTGEITQRLQTLVLLTMAGWCQTLGLKDMEEG